MPHRRLNANYQRVVRKVRYVVLAYIPQQVRFFLFLQKPHLTAAFPDSNRLGLLVQLVQLCTVAFFSTRKRAHLVLPMLQVAQ